jgi:vancomycin resistance protein VanJ
LGRSLLAASALLCVTATTVHLWRSDATVALALLPPWLWLGPGAVLCALGWTRRDRPWAVATLGAWIAFVLVCAEDVRSLARPCRAESPQWSEARRRGEAIRVLSLNCNGGNTNAAAEVVAHDPDLVLLQESPRRPFVESLARSLFGDDVGVLWSAEASILARGAIEESPPPATDRTRVVRARVRLRSGIELEAINVRLSPFAVRLDLWRPDCWREQAATRRMHRKQLRPALDHIESLPARVPVLCAGDFNEPARGLPYDLFPKRLRDAFREAGCGWGNTILNDFPVLRIDQVWVSEPFRVQSVRTVRTVHSDHRMVVCDLWLPPAR